jgi:hypothetical protein
MRLADKWKTTGHLAATRRPSSNLRAGPLLQRQRHKAAVAVGTHYQ